MYDVAIIGAGPAGATLARLIGRQYRVLLGEAAGWISPSSAEGLSYAFRSACILAEVLHAGMENVERRYHSATTALRRNILLKGLKSRIVFNPPLRRIIMRLGLHSMAIYGPPAPLSPIRKQVPSKSPEVPGFPLSRE